MNVEHVAADVEVVDDKGVESVLAHCMAIIEARKYSRHRFVIDLDASPPSKELLGRWAAQKYHQVYRQNLIFSIIHAKTQYEDVRQFMVEQLVAEETPINCGSDTHYNLMRRFAQACGVPGDAFTEEAAHPEVIAYVDKLLSIIRREHFVVALLAIYAIEAQSGESVERLLAALRRNYDFKEDELEWFTVHSDADDDHADEGLRLVRKYADQCPDYESRAPLVVGEICDAWLRLHDTYAAILGSQVRVS
ncbi:MAG: iron-containing redox enzyme family protein [Ramlibacter sp.]|nr:iron-containing redox enzyme family protein [Ramlibacter sp.]